MALIDYINNNPELLLQYEKHLKKVNLLQERIDAAANYPKSEVVVVTNIRTGHVDRFRVLPNGNISVARVKYSIEGNPYAFAKDILAAYGLSSLVEVYTRVGSDSRRWREWIKLELT